MQAEVLARRCALWALHSATPYGCDERAQIEKTLGRPWLLPESDWRHHPVGAAHKQAIDALRTNADAALPAS